MHGQLLGHKDAMKHLLSAICVVELIGSEKALYSMLLFNSTPRQMAIVRCCGRDKTTKVKITEVTKHCSAGKV